MRTTTCALASPTHNVTPHIATNRRFLMDIRTSGIAHVREQLIRSWDLQSGERASKGLSSTDGLDQRKAALVAHPEVSADETSMVVAHSLPGVIAGRARSGDEAIREC
jgi:hypothetical protein